MRRGTWFFMRFKGALLGAVILMSACSHQPERAETSAKESTAAESIEAERTEAESTEAHSEEEETQAKEETKPAILRNLGVDTSVLSETYYKAGDLNSYISLSPDYEGNTDMFETGSLYISLRKGYDEGTEGYEGSAVLVTEPGETEYSVDCEFYGSRVIDSVAGYMEPFGEKLQGEAVISFKQDDESGTVISIGGDVPFAGEYYKESCIENLDVRERFLGRLELSGLSAEKLGLLRNTIYAFHGRKFKDETLQAYFDGRCWYRPETEPEQFSEAVFSDIERANLKLIGMLEQEKKEGKEDGSGEPGNMAPAAPYVEFLEQGRLYGNLKDGRILACQVSWETGLGFDVKGANDMGGYWEVEGEISRPVTMTRAQWEEVQEGGTAFLTANELTGERYCLRYEKDSGYLYYKEGEEPEKGDTMVSYNYNTGLYELSQLSDDTVMKPVYKGTIRVAKGALEGGHVTAARASHNAMEILSGAPDGWEQYGGNYIVYDPSGCILAAYYLGD